MLYAINVCVLLLLGAQKSLNTAGKKKQCDEKSPKAHGLCPKVSQGSRTKTSKQHHTATSNAKKRGDMYTQFSYFYSRFKCIESVKMLMVLVHTVPSFFSSSSFGVCPCMSCTRIISLCVIFAILLFQFGPSFLPFTVSFLVSFCANAYRPYNRACECIARALYRPS